MARARTTRPPAPPSQQLPEVRHLMEAFESLDPTTASTVLAQFLEHVEAQAQDRSERLLEQAAAMDRLRAVASRRK